ncbi:hypothetical protein INS49_012785 [Diaporthe citri]|uniref:uncharacterized protein n=1 Tax=Diaporthe citri TaxID=83186 RepID=UPI001C7F23C5|nr:uncharacterized protein INS49_012785 [Diaporthe citri]KAG6359264.1 hypothetical protein INS49_012785 [Diaporthe citri]
MALPAVARPTVEECGSRVSIFGTTAADREEPIPLAMLQGSNRGPPSHDPDRMPIAMQIPLRVLV